mmetsp:Transcript_14788/g.30089  ORF Transcript_14788/g.30089 Transcript_14788/m.30089 type:complete len:80 (-) Transcript_14788:427-666(-)
MGISWISGATKDASSISPDTGTATESTATGTAAPKKKMCCVCLDTKKERDECLVANGEEACKAFIEAHKKCLRSEGFDV